MFNFRFVPVITLLIGATQSRIIPIIYEDYEFCVNETFNAGKFDFSELEFMAESDDHVYVNGSWKFVKEVHAPWTATIFTEKYDRSQWVIDTLYKRIPDFCAVVQDPLQPWYPLTSHFEHKNCPFPAGVSLKKFTIIE